MPFRQSSVKGTDAYSLPPSNDLNFNDLILSRKMVTSLEDTTIYVFDHQLKYIFVEGELGEAGMEGKYIYEVQSQRFWSELLEGHLLALTGKTCTLTYENKGHFYEAKFVPFTKEGVPERMGMCIIRTVTQTRKMEQELKSRCLELEQFAYSVSHDLRSPLRSIAGFAQLLERKYKSQLNEEGREYIDFIVGNTIRMNELVKGLLKLTFLNEQEVEDEILDTQELLAQVLQNLDALMKERDAIVLYDALPPIKGNAVQVTQLFQNLIENGIKFNHSNPITIMISVKAEQRDWIIEISDNGIGIDKRYKDEIFNLFNRIDHKGEVSGTGLGLTICKKIVEGMGGSIWLESTVGKGSSFFIRIPQLEKADF